MKGEYSMVYLDRINELLESTILKNTTSKILQHMGRIRNASSLEQARRWVMELLQNARDVSKEDGIKIRIILTKEELIFEHTGKPFRVKDVLSIINQASSKDDSIESVGKFGTGFVTTFQLSEVVTLRSVLHEEGESPVSFQITLDRSGTNDNEIQTSIENSMKELKNCVSNPIPFDYKKDGYHTSFIYKLQSGYERNIARTGIVDLKNTVNEILLFSEKIQEIRIVIDLPEEKKMTSYQILDRDTIDEKIGIYQKNVVWRKWDGYCEFEESDIAKAEEEFHHLVYIQKNRLTLSLEVDEEHNILPVDNEKARVFIDFPLIGSEQFPFPVVINDRELHPNEPRSGITLVDSERSMEAMDNKEIMSQAVQLYGDFLRFLVQKEYRQIYNMIQIPVWRENAELSETWVTQNIYLGLYGHIRKENIIETDCGITSLENSNIRFVKANSMKLKEKVYWLVSEQKKYATVNYQVEWLEILKGYECGGNQLFSIDLKYILSHIQRIINAFESDKIAMRWLNYLYYTCMEIDEFAAEIKSGNVAIYPNQIPQSFEKILGGRTLKSHKIMKEDAISDSLLREISEHFLGYNNMKEYRENLVSKEFDLVEGDLEKYTDEHLVGEINVYLNFIMNNYKMDQLNESIQVGCAKLAEWIDIHLEKDKELVKKYFPQFASEEGKAKLLTSKAIAAISKDLRNQKEENLRLKQELEELRNFLQSKNENPDELWCGDVNFTLDELNAYGGNKEEFARMVGNSGEEFAYGILKSVFEERDTKVLNTYPIFNQFVAKMQKFIDQTDCMVEVIRPDTETFKQPGYDIVIRVTDVEHRVLSQQFFEVKTHTVKSVNRNQIYLSEEQMKFALKTKDDYSVMKISFNPASNLCSLENTFNHIAKVIGEGSWRHLDKGYYYQVRNA